MSRVIADMDAPAASARVSPVVLEATAGCYSPALPGWNDSEHWQISSGVGAEGFDVAMSVVMSSRNPDLKDLLLKCVSDALDQVDAVHSVLEPDAVRPLFTMLLLYVLACLFLWPPMFR